MIVSNTCRKRPWRRNGQAWLCWLAAACLAPAACALDPNRSIAEYTQTHWSREQGFPGGDVHALAATPDGYLWIGAEKGLVRFDGVGFRLFNHTNAPAFASDSVLGLKVDRAGALWIRLNSPGMLRYRGRAFETLFPADVAETGVTAMAPGIRGGMLLARAREVVRADGGTFTRVAHDLGYRARPLISIAETSDGTLWIGTRDEGLLSVHGAELAAQRLLPDRKINCLLAGTGSQLWIGTDHGLALWNGKAISIQAMPDSLRHDEILALARDRDSNLWVGTNTGLVRFDAHGAASVKRSASRRPNSVDALLEDREGNLWVGGSGGIERYRDSLFLAYPVSADDPSENAGPLYVDAARRTWYGPSDGGLSSLGEAARGNTSVDALSKDVVYSITGGPGEIWVGRQRGGLTQFLLSGDAFSAKTFTAADGLAPGSVYAAYRSRDGTVWAGTLNGGLSCVRHGRVTTYTVDNGLVSNSIYAIEEASDGTIWLATPNGLQSFTNGPGRVYSGRDGMPPGRINCITEDSADVLWIGTDAGLAFIRSGRLQIPRDLPASLLEPVFGIADDGHGYLWVASADHVVRANRASLAGDGGAANDFREFGSADGIPSTEGVRRSRSVAKDRLGRIWFSLRRGIAVVDPARVAGQSAPAMVHIESASADGRPLNLESPLRIPVRQQRIVFSYIGVSLSVPERVRYRYRLDGFDRDWNEATAERETSYTNLLPGFYRFRVVASNSAGVWNSSEAALALRIIPPYWQTLWFRVAIAVLAMLTLAAIFRFRMRSFAARMNLRFEERFAERTRIARELHDTLLQGFLSASMQLHVAADLVPESSQAKPIMARALELIRQVIEEGRVAVLGLRSPANAVADLEQAFSAIQYELMLDKHVGKSGQEETAFRVVVDGDPRPLRPALREEVYRIAREALINAFRHARARNIQIEMTYGSNRLRIVVRDDGCGIPTEILRSGREGHWGLTMMRERAARIGARLHVNSISPAGTAVELSIPGKIIYEGHAAGRLTWLERHLRRIRGQQSPERS